MDFKRFSDKVDRWLRRFRATGLGKKLQYEPHVIRTVEYIDPDGDDKLLVIFPEVDYLKSLFLQVAPKMEYTGYDITSGDPLPVGPFGKCVLFLVTRFIEREFLCSICDRVSGRFYLVSYLGGHRFFDMTLRIVDAVSHSLLGKEEEIVAQCDCFEFLNRVEYQREHIVIVEYRVNH